MTTASDKTKEALCFAAALLAGHALGFYFQDPLAIFNGLGWDGRIYYQMALQYMNGEEFAQRTPFVHRQLLPALAGALAGDEKGLLATFRVINLLFATAAAIVIWRLLQFYVDDWRLRVLAASLFPLHFICYIRFTYWNAIQTDPPALLAVALMLYVAHKFRHGRGKAKTLALLGMAAVCFFAAYNRGSSLYLALFPLLCLPFAPQYTSLYARIPALLRQWRPLLFLPALAFAAGLWWTRYNANITGVYGQEALGSDNYWLYSLMVGYQRSLFKFVHGALIAFGPLLAVVFWQWRAVCAALWEHWHWLAMLAIVSFYALDDNARQYSHIFPLYAVLLGIALQAGWQNLRRRPLLLALLLLAQAVSMRLFWSLPTDAPLHESLIPPNAPVAIPLLFTPWTSDFIIYDLFPLLARGIAGPAGLIQYLAFTTAALLWLNYPLEEESAAPDAEPPPPTQEKEEVEKTQMSSAPAVPFARRFRGNAAVELAAWAAGKATGKPRLLRASHPASQTPFYLRMPSSDLFAYWQVFEREEYLFAAPTSPQNIIEAGANVGYTSLWLAGRFPNARIVALEPEPQNFALLQKNVAGYANIIPVCAALWNANEPVNVVDPNLGEWGYSVAAAGANVGARIAAHSVPGITMERLMAEHNMERVDIVKIDIEGAEREVFAAANMDWLAKTDALIVELHERLKPGCDAAFYNAVDLAQFERRWWRGENIYLSRGNIAPADK